MLKAQQSSTTNDNEVGEIVECGASSSSRGGRSTVVKPAHTGKNNNNNNITISADVSKMRIPATTRTPTTTAQASTSASAKKSTLTTTKRRHLENKGEIVKTNEMSRQLTTMSRKKISPTNCTIANTITPTNSTKNRTTMIKTISSTEKKSLTLRKNKCPTSEPHEISSQRALKGKTSKLVPPVYGKIFSTTTTATTNTKTPKNIRCELLESIETKQSTFESGLPTTLPASNLAEQKAQLRSNFFKDIQRDQTDCVSRKDTKTEFHSRVLVKEQIGNNQLTEYLLKSCDNNRESRPAIFLPESISEEIGESSEELQTVLLPLTCNTSSAAKLSLIDQRKLELSRKFTTQTTVKATTQSSRDNPLIEFRRVAKLVKKFDKMIVNPDKSLEQAMITLKPDIQDQRHNSPLSDEGCNLGQSPYSTDDENDNDDNVSIRTSSTMIEIPRNLKRKDKVARSASSDSALGLEVDDPMDASVRPMTPPTDQQNQKRRMTLTVTDLPLRPALLPLAEPTTLPDSPTPEIQQTLQNLISQTTVPSKVLLEERVVELPKPEPLLRSPCQAHASSRRESEQSCISDYPLSESGNIPGVRYVRTPSVVVSDYSDDVMCGITLEEIEYFRAQRLRRRSSLETTGTEKDTETHSDISASSSCSNLYYCGSTISALDGAECLVNGRRVQLERKTSDCSTCSASGNEDENTSTSSSAFTLTEDNNDRDIADMLAAQHLCSKRAKKVGDSAESTTDFPSTYLNVRSQFMENRP